uniref:Uncharacterized protein n=1 Tax=Anguilla anguilla TaxID=7936 RepID=A0A0E9TP90_ANGAN
MIGKDPESQGTQTGVFLHIETALYNS